MSSLLNHSELLAQYEIISDGSFKERLDTYFKDIAVSDLFKEEELRLSGDEVDRFKEAINTIILKGSRVLVVGDYDCDGIMATSIFMRLLAHLKINANYYIPSRTKEGYGLNETIVQTAIDYHFDYIITLDNGIKAKAAIAKAYENGIEVIIIDHHQFEELPKAKAIIHPAFLGPYFDDLCTGGLVYLLSLIYYDDPYSSVLAMLATLADVVRVFGANRSLIKDGLKILNRGDIALNIRALSNVKRYSYDDVVFKIVPKINALSRLDPLCNVNSFIPYFRDGKEDIVTLEKIDIINTLRKDKSLAMVNDARNRVSDKPFILISSDHYLEGLCGLVASRLADEYKRPTLILAKKDGLYKGSGRSPKGFDLYGNLAPLAAHFKAFGGHRQAIGITVDEDGLKKLEEYATQIKSAETKRPKEQVIKITQADMTLENIDLLKLYEPYGEGLRKPLFYLEDPKIKSRYLIKGLYPKYVLANNQELFGFEKSQFVESLSGAIGTLDVSDFCKTKITMSLKEIVL